MIPDREQIISEWFDGYSRRWIEAADSHVARNLELKRDHTACVADFARRLASSVKMAPETAELVAIAAWLHDVGRFPQFTNYRTFSDADSVCHAALGVAEIDAAGILAVFSAEERRIIRSAVAWHNRFGLPDDARGPEREVAGMIRDADKLDIWRVMLDYYSKGGVRDNPAVVLGLPDDGWSPEFVDSVLASRCAVSSRKRTLVDMQLLQLSWLFDLNCPHSFRLFSECDYLERLLGLLPRHDDMDRVRGHIRRHVEQRLSPMKYGGRI